MLRALSTLLASCLVLVASPGCLDERGGPGEVGAAGAGGCPDDCPCAPGVTRACEQDASGSPVVWPRLDDRGNPLGACKRGIQACDEGGLWGACSGAVEPSDEVCDGLDNDCDGQIDEGVKNPPLWYLDGDGDGHGSPSVKPVSGCENPGKLAVHCPGGAAPCEARWRLEKDTKTALDCDDDDAEVHPGAWDGPEARVVPFGIVPPGLQAEFFQNFFDPANPLAARNRKDARTDLAINFDWGAGAVSKWLQPGPLAARWTGRILVPQAGDFFFQADCGGKVRLLIDDATAFDDWISAEEHERTVSLSSGEHSLRFEVLEGSGQARARLLWSGPGVSDLPIPLALVSQPAEGASPDRCGDKKDNDCSGALDDGRFKLSGTAFDLGCDAECNPIESDPTRRTTRPCGYPEVKGVCHPGAQTCQPDGLWSECVGEQAKMAGAEDCSTPDIDEDCSGSTLDGCDCAGAPLPPCEGCNESSGLCILGSPVSICDDPGTNGGAACDAGGGCDGVVSCDGCRKTGSCEVGETRPAGVRCGRAVHRRCEPGVCEPGAGVHLDEPLAFSWEANPRNVQLNSAYPETPVVTAFVATHQTQVVAYRSESKTDVPYAFSPYIFAVPGHYSYGASGWASGAADKDKGVEIRVCLYDETGAYLDDVPGETPCVSQSFKPDGPWTVKGEFSLPQARCALGKRLMVGVEKASQPAAGNNTSHGFQIQAFDFRCAGDPNCEEGADMSGF